MTFGFQDVNLCLRKSLVLNSMRIIGCRFKIPKPPQPDSIHNLCWFNAHFAPRIQDTQTQDKLSGGYELKPTVPFSHQQVSKYQVINVVNLIYGNIFCVGRGNRHFDLYCRRNRPIHFSVERWKRRGLRKKKWTERCLFPARVGIFIL